MPARGPLFLLMATLLLATGAAAQVGWADGFTPVTASTATQYFEVHDGTVAWLSKVPAGFNIVLTDLEGGNDIVTSIPSPEGQELLVGCFAYDGRWVAWCDNRFGTSDVFAVDTVSGQLVRVTDTGAQDVEAALGGGRLVWSSDGALWMRDLTNGTSWRIDTGPGAAREPALAGQTVAWIRLANGTRYVVAVDLAGGGQRALSESNGTYAHRLVGDGDLFAWEVYVQRNPGKAEAGFAATVVQAVEAAGGEVRNLTRVEDFQAGRGSPLEVDLGGSRIAWLDPTLRVRDLVSYNWQTGREERLESKAEGVAVSDRFAVVLAATGESGEWQLLSRGWGTGGDDRGLDIGWGGLGPLAAAVAWAALARRRSA